MADPIDADQVLRDAIDQVRNANGWTQGELVTDFIIVMSVQSYGDQGRAVNGVQVLHPPEVPFYRLVGLLDLAADALRSRIGRIG